MTVAIMQPYFYPYIGYFQLINFADKFIFYDDVNFIKGGWVNRNRILINGKPHFINAEMSNASSNKLISEIGLNATPKWRIKLLRTIEQNYAKAPHFDEIFPVIEKGIKRDASSLSVFLKNCILDILAILEIKTEIIYESNNYANSMLHGPDRVIDICRIEKAKRYVNPIGGLNLYNKDLFLDNEIDLVFLEAKTILYKQFSDDFEPNLSIIDVLMHAGILETQQMLNEFELV